ncbi:ribose-phosphate diphosphokinase [Hydrogenophaga sp. PAMC20947]|uniref:ribose-phosphate diphosphokinase n=1 Tax=Hydrogenophaga sp. PAMC20947 TaxID=2565558 RepID=UPI00109DA3AE|nr:ribose-phosphate diphosphokinase [Hydrogenophaga sp. PAMC20947]QCB45745.1 ribose-phosphate diphosphokinase [Hydrogenophaga sp. PAMC20947]
MPVPQSNPAGCLLYCAEDAELAERAAQAAALEPRAIERHRFPDGELRLRLPEQLPARVVIWRSLYDPNEKLVELLLTAQAARTLGARHLTLVAPYLAYMRQDMAFQPGEVVSQRIVGRFLADLFDAVITVDPHLHRVATLEDAIPVPDAVVLSGAPVLADLVHQHRPQALLIGPDEESLQWVAQAAARHGWDHAVCRKVRRGDRDVVVQLPDLSVLGRTVVLMDDVASSGHTLAQASQALLAAGAASVDVAVTHALFAEGALALVKTAGVGEIWSTDCIPHASNAVSMVPALAQALRDQASVKHPA